MEDLTGVELGQYRIESPIGEGGMAAVYQAYQRAMDRYVALKVLPKHFASDSEFIGRFEQEAKVIAKLQHVHILPVFDFGEAEGYTYIVMPFVETGTISDILKSEPLPQSQVRRVTTQVAEALGYAHSYGVVHRDVKPSNILIDGVGNCLLTDFGIAKIVEGTSHFTQSGAIIGTPAYMSPEQIRGESLDGRSDLYSLGVLLFEMATGRLPYEAETPPAIFVKHLHDSLPDPQEINSDLSEAVDSIILKSLAKQQEDRFQTADEMARALRLAIAEIDEPPAMLVQTSGLPQTVASDAVHTVKPPKAQSEQETRLLETSTISVRIIQLLKKVPAWVWAGGALTVISLVAVQNISFPEQVQSPTMEASTPLPIAVAVTVAPTEGVLLEAPTSIPSTPELMNSATPVSSPTAALINAKNAAEMVELRSVPGPCCGFVASPDGSKLAGVLWDGSVGIWGVNDGQLIHKLSGIKGHVSSLDWAPDGALLATGSGDAKVRIWDIELGELIREFQGHTEGINDLIFSPSGEHVASISDRGLLVWNLAAEEDQKLRIDLGVGHTGFNLRLGAGHALAFLDDGSRLLAPTRNGLEVLDLASGRVVNRMDGWPGSINSLAISPDGQLVAAGSYLWGVRVWRIEDGALLYHVGEDVGPANHVAFSPDGTVLASAMGRSILGYGSILLWDSLDGSLIHDLDLGESRGADQISFSPEGSVLGGFLWSDPMGGAVRMWDIESGEVLREMEAGDWSSSYSFLPDGSTMAVATTFNDDSVLTIWGFDS